MIRLEDLNKHQEAINIDDLCHIRTAGTMVSERLHAGAGKYDFPVLCCLLEGG